MKATILTLGGILLAKVALAAASETEAEEFTGPFPSWRDVQRDYHAAGDGRADDTAAFQRALDDLAVHSNFCVLYIPAGTYRLTSTIKTVRRKHTECQGIAVVGESPARTILRWDGPDDGTIFQYDAWYSKISRLTIDGAGRAQAGLQYGPAFSTYNETSDLIFRDVAVGILLGGEKYQGQAENEVLRCRFVNCTDAGVKTAGFNSMDIWVWYSKFEDCGRALFNSKGNFHAWQNLFARSRVADIGSQNLMVFSFVNNTSVESARFLDFESGHTWGSPTTISGNRILNPTENFPLRLGNGGPYLVMDNIFKMAAGRNQAIKMTWGDQTLLGNVYTASNAVLENGRFRRVAETVRPREAVDASIPPLPAAPPRKERRIFEVPSGADAVAIQKILDEAAKLTNQRAVVHFPMGRYKITRTLVAPPGCDAQLVGDSAGQTGSRLDWAGPAGGVLLKLAGPARETLRDLHFSAGNGRALLVEDADQRGGRIFADQLNVSGPARLLGTNQNTEEIFAALRVNGLVQTDVLLRCFQGSGNAGTWVEVAGNGTTTHSNQVSIFTGASSSAQGQYAVHDGGRLVARALYHERSTGALRGLRLTGSGSLAVDASRFSYETSADKPLVELENFHGLFTVATSQLQPVGKSHTCRFEITGDCASASALALNDLFWVFEPGVDSSKVWLDNSMSHVRGGLLGCNMNTQREGIFKRGGFAFLENLTPGSPTNGLSDAELEQDLALLREARVWLPGGTQTGVTDLRMYRVMAEGGRPPVVEFTKNYATDR